jgi:hypothetical protein
MNYTTHTIEIETVLGDNDEFDNAFIAYLDEYSIDYKIGQNGESGYPNVKYTGGPIALSNMLRERFGLDNDDIRNLCPQLYDENREE